MPTYCFETPDGQVVEKIFSIGKAPRQIELDGQIARRSFRAETKTIPTTSGWPLECVASGVHAKQRNELSDYLKRKGVPTDVTKDGNPVYRDARHRARALKARGFYDKNAYA